jgi:large subunit ribosomal protein L9
MKIILLENIASLGLKGEVKEVSDGYAVNFLLPQAKATLATPTQLAKLKAEVDKQASQVAAQGESYEKIKRVLNQQTLGFSGKVSTKNHLFKNILIHDIIEDVRKRYGLDLHQNWFKGTVALKTVGRQELKLQLPNKEIISLFINIKAL